MWRFIVGVVFSTTLSAYSFSPIAGDKVDVQQQEKPLREILYEEIRKHKVLSYKGLWKAFKKTDALPDYEDKVFDIYSYKASGSPYVYTFFTDQCGQYKKEGDCYNREHSFPKAWWGGGLKTPMAKDLFHIYPTDGYVNNMRSNYPYAEVADDGAKISLNGSKLGKAKDPSLKGKFFEPIDEFKGDLARGYFYLLTAYYDRVADWKSPILKGNNLTQWAKDILVRWHINDPVSPKELERNRQIELIQGNYNPFIVHPGYVKAIWKDSKDIEHDKKIEATTHGQYNPFAEHPKQIQQNMEQ